MTSLRIPKKGPEESAVFTLADGEKIRINYENVYIYKSLNKTTVVEIGYGDRETFVLDMTFETFDNRINEYKQAMKDYWASSDSW